MKIRIAFLLSILLMPFSLCLAGQASKAQGVPATVGQNEPPKLTGSTLKVKDIVSKADVIFVGRITAMGYEENPPATESPSIGSHYHGVEVQVLQVLRGSIGTQTSVALFAFSLQEKLPAVGSSYIFFITKNGQIATHNPDPFEALKLLPATDADIAEVKALIAAAPAGK